ncbi:hypothetical protein [Nocardia brasiliensis]|uniref:hypothetical protein n=1 Tax=Nocardia brasiliensis TaxID=37326 RepID=UPI0024560B78|nr:hypothetical protein [Nocardia brasiliensis]
MTVDSATLNGSGHDEKGHDVGDDEQLSMDLGVEQTAWGRWEDPERHAAQVQKFINDAKLERIPSEPWPENSTEIKRLDPVIAEWFPDMAAVMSPEKSDKVDSFVCFLGEMLIRFAGAEWIEYEWFGRDKSLYDDVNPALRFDNFDEDERTAWSLVKAIVEYYPDDHDGMATKMASIIREYAGYHQEKIDAEA